MQHSELAELAALIAVNGSALVHAPTEIAEAAIQQYWLASRYRFDAWGRALKRCGGAVAPVPRTRPSASLSAIVEEVLASEILTRVWTAVLCAFDRRRNEAEIEPLARGIWLGHLEARNRALALLMHAPGVRVEDAVALNGLRARAERWTDLLLGRLLSELPAACRFVVEFAPNPDRARDFAADLRDEGPDSAAWLLTLASLRVAFREGLSAPAPHEELNARIAAAMLACFPTELFDATGQFHSLWMLRIATTTADAQGLVSSLYDLENVRGIRRRLSGDGLGRSY
jgi:hypothetical protein